MSKIDLDFILKIKEVIDEYDKKGLSLYIGFNPQGLYFECYPDPECDYDFNKYRYSRDISYHSLKNMKDLDIKNLLELFKKDFENNVVTVHFNCTKAESEE